MKDTRPDSERLAEIEAGLRHNIERPGYWLAPVGSVEVAWLVAKVRELEADKRRLDWTETHEADVVCLFWREGISIEDPAARYDPPHWMVCPRGDLIEGATDLPTVRDAIDAAITAEKSGSRE